MSEYVQTRVANGTVNSLSLDMVRALTAALLAWRDEAGVDAVNGMFELKYFSGVTSRPRQEAKHPRPRSGLLSYNSQEQKTPRTLYPTARSRRC